MGRIWELPKIRRAGEQKPQTSGFFKFLEPSPTPSTGSRSAAISYR